MIENNTEQIYLESLHKFLSENVDSKKFGLRNGYIYSHAIVKLRFELFISKEKLGLKYPNPNLDDFKITSLTNLIKEIDSGFEHRTYGDKNEYSIWEIEISQFSNSEIESFLKMIQDKLF